MEAISQKDQTGNLILSQEILTPYSCPKLEVINLRLLFSAVTFSFRHILLSTDMHRQH